MGNMQYQTGIFESETNVLDLPDAEIEYHPGFIAAAAAKDLYQELLSDTDWQQDTIRVYGKQHLTPRLTSWVGESWMSYRYSQHTMQPVAWSKRLLELKEEIEEISTERFNSVLLNYYRDGQDSNGWHSDDEPELGNQPSIASLSLGAARDFQLRHKSRHSLKRNLSLESGSLLLMRGTTQQYWQHQVPKRAHAQGRINLTFRTIIQPAKT